MNAWAFKLSSSFFIPHPSSLIPHAAAILLIFLLVPFAAAAQTSVKVETAGEPCPLAFDMREAEKEFASAAGKYEGQFRGLILERGLRLPLRDVSDATLRDLMRTLHQRFQEETAVLFYDDDETTFRVWLIDSEGIRAFHRALLSREQLESAVAALRESLGVEDLEAARLPPRLRPKRAAAPPALNPRALLPRRLLALSSLLLPADIVCALASVRHLIVVPVLDLGTVPFAALRPFDASSSLIDRMSVTIAPSLFDVGQRAESWSADFRQPLLVGNPYLAPSAGWESLNGAEREARFAGQTFGTQPLTGRKATRDAILNRAAAADLLYFATHGAADTARPLDGGFLVFSGPQGAESLWTAREIQQASLRARLVVLSACQTGLGKTHDAGVIGLARSFQLAGVPRVVMSLWSVYDDASAELMQAFALNLRRQPPAEALRQAMLEVRKRRPDPAEWASFVIFGTPQ